MTTNELEDFLAEQKEGEKGNLLILVSLSTDFN